MKNKVAVVTEAGAGLGRNIVERFTEGPSVVIVEIDRGGGEPAPQSIRPRGEALVKTDVSDEEPVRTLAEKAPRTVGGFMRHRRTRSEKWK